MTAAKGRRTRRRGLWPLYLMMAPRLLYLLINNVLPLFGLTMAFKDINFSQGLLQGIIQGDWAGLKHFRYLFQTKDAWIITRNTICYNLAFILINTAAGFFFALQLTKIRSRFLTGLFQGILLFPNFISWVVVSYLVLAFLNVSTGFLNSAVLPALGLAPAAWYSEPKFWPFILTVVNLWKEAGLQCVIYYAAMIAIDPVIYEAAALDGARPARQTLQITLPLVAPMVVMMVLMSVGKIMYSDFGLFYQVPLDSGILYNATGTIDTYVYRTLTKVGNVSMSAAAGAYQSVVGFVLVLVSNFTVRRLSPGNAVF